MKTHIYIGRGDDRFGPFGDRCPPNAVEGDRVGQLFNDEGEDSQIQSIYQVGASKASWCASLWDTIPPDILWRFDGSKYTLFTVVKKYTLDWRNTPFESRYNLSIHKEEWSDLEMLAKGERKLWGIHCTAFIPFKDPHPQGYKGVWGNFDLWLWSRCPDMKTHDELSSGYHVLMWG